MTRRRSGAGKTGAARIALVHDWLVGRRGGELVLDRLARLVLEHHEPAGLFVMFDDGRAVTPNLSRLPTTVAPLGKRPGANRLRRWLLFRYPAAVRALSHALEREHAGRPIELVISSSSAAVKAIEPPEGVPHLCYCHAPARYLWSQENEYARASAPARLGLRVFGPGLRTWDAQSVKRVTKFLANSRHTAREIERVYRRDAEVVHPPVRTHLFTPDEREARQEFWLSVAALEPYKRVDLAIEAALLAGRQLMVVGTGTQGKQLRKHARDTARRLHKAGMGAGRDKLVQFLGHVGDEQLVILYRRAAALIHPQVEDFGIAALEAQACGCPVIARRLGGALDTVLEGRTGAFFDEPEPRAIIEAFGRCPTGVGDQCRRHALTFGEARFDKQILDLIGAMTGRGAAGAS